MLTATGKALQEGLPAAYNTNNGNLLDTNGVLTTDITAVKGYRLPTEAEWEYAARNMGIDPGSSPSGTNAGYETNVAWFYDNSGGKTHPLGEKIPNDLGIYDMSGNATEWCYDWYDNYGSTNAINPVGPLSGTLKVCRGGDLFSDAINLKSAYRNSNSPTLKASNIGFRIVRSE